MSFKKISKVLVPVLMFFSIIGIGFVKENSINYETQDLEYPLNVESINLEELRKSNLPIIIDFGADSCIPCKEMTPILQALNEEFQSEAIVQFVDVWKNPEVATGFPVRVIPTQVFVNSDGSPYIPSEELTMMIQFSMYLDNQTDEHIFTTHQGGLTEEQMRLILTDMGVK